jgi:glutamate dehydrogenase/leucine dehydrogenase
MLDEPRRPRSEAFLRALGRAIDALGGRYIAAEDLNATQADMDGIALETPWVTGIDVARGGSGDPSPVTAVGVLHGMHAVCAELFGDRALTGRRVVVQGVGHVGASLVALLVAEGASVAVADVDAARARALGDVVDRVEVVDVDAVLDEPCDVLAPCALGGVVTVESVERLQCAAVCGAANNQLLDAAAGDALAARGILYAPDFVVNAGGIINIAHEWAPGGYSVDAALAAARAIEQTTQRVFALARERDLTAARAAETLARERIASEGAGRRWPPGTDHPLLHR